MNWIRLKKLHLFVFLILCGTIVGFASSANVLPKTKSNIKHPIIKIKTPNKVPILNPSAKIPNSKLVYQTLQKYLKPLLVKIKKLQAPNLPTLNLKAYQTTYQQLTNIQTQRLAKWSVQALQNQPLIQCWKEFQTKNLQLTNFNVKWKNIKTYQCWRLLRKKVN